MRSLFALVLVAACGYPPLTTSVDGNNRDSNTDGKTGSGSDGSTSPCEVVASYGAVNPTAGMAVFYPGKSGAPDQESYLGQLNNDTPADFLEVDLYSDTAPDFPAAIRPTTITLGDVNDMTCGGCVIIEANCTDCYDNPVYTSTYMASGGTLAVTSTSGTFTATLTNVTFLHVNIVESTGATTVIDDGCNTAITSASLSATVVQQ